jgi:hypothetical protein
VSEMIVGNLKSHNIAWWLLFCALCVAIKT